MFLPIGGRLAIPLAELRFRFSRSGGPGGQNVNKLATRVELLFDVANSPSLNDVERQRLREELARYIDTSGQLRLVSQESRSQQQNRVVAIARFQTLLAAALRPRKKRRATRPGAGARERRLQAKRHRADRKQERRRPML